MKGTTVWKQMCIPWQLVQIQVTVTSTFMNTGWDSPNSWAILCDLLRSCTTATIMALLIAGVSTVYRWHTFTIPQVLHFMYHRDATVIVKKYVDDINQDNVAHSHASVLAQLLQPWELTACYSIPRGHIPWSFNDTKLCCAVVCDPIWWWCISHI